VDAAAAATTATIDFFVRRPPAPLRRLAFSAFSSAPLFLLMKESSPPPRAVLSSVVQHELLHRGGRRRRHDRLFRSTSTGAALPFLLFLLLRGSSSLDLSHLSLSPSRLLFLVPLLHHDTQAANDAAGFDPNRSRVSFNRMEEWRNCVISGDLLQVPGIGNAAVRLLDERADITNTYQLFGKYLQLKGPEPEAMTDPVIHADKVWMWLKGLGINSNRSSIVVALGEKMSQTFPGIYDPSSYESAEAGADE
jgi:hypothetical protein